MDGAAANFPDINFVIFHVGLPFLDEVCWQLIRHPNLYASIAATLNFIVRSPRQFAETIGKLLFWCGEDKIVYGSEAPIWQPQWALRAFKEFQIPQDLCEGYGYPQLTDQANARSSARTCCAARNGRRGDEGPPGPAAVALNPPRRAECSRRNVSGGSSAGREAESSRDLTVPVKRLLAAALLVLAAAACAPAPEAARPRRVLPANRGHCPRSPLAP